MARPGRIERLRPVRRAKRLKTPYFLRLHFRGIRTTHRKWAAVAQLVEHRIRNAGVGGSNPFRGTSFRSRFLTARVLSAHSSCGGRGFESLPRRQFSLPIPYRQSSVSALGMRGSGVRIPSAAPVFSAHSQNSRLHRHVLLTAGFSRPQRLLVEPALRRSNRQIPSRHLFLAPEAADDFKRLKAGVRATVRAALETHLRHEPRKTSRSRIKRLRGLGHPQYRLRVDEIRVFYDVFETTVEILAIVSKSEADSWLAQFGNRE